MNEEYQEYERITTTINLLLMYIAKLEAERDYYQSASIFQGTANTPKPKEIDQLEEY